MQMGLRKSTPLKRRRSAAKAAVAAAVLAVCQSRGALAQSTAVFTGAGDGTSWANAKNWTTGGVKSVAPSNVAPGDDLQFDPTGNLQVNLGADRVVNSLNFSSGTTTLDAPGSTHTLAITSGDINGISAFAGSSATINARLISSVPVTFSGPSSEFVLNNAANDFPAGIVVGNIANEKLGDDDAVRVVFNALSALGSGPVTFGGGILLETLSSPQTLSQPVTIQGSGTLGLNDDNLTLSAQVTAERYSDFSIGGPSTASLHITGSSSDSYGPISQVNVAAPTFLGKSAGAVALPGGQIVVNSTLQLLADNQTASNQTLKLLSGEFELNGHSTMIGSIDAALGTSIFLGSGTLTVSGNIGGGPEPDALDALYGFAVAANITGIGGSLTKDSGAFLSLFGTNTFTGTLNVSAGTLQAGSNQSLGKPSVILVGSGATLDFDGQSIGALPLKISGLGASSTGAVLNSSLTPASFAGQITLTGNTAIGGAGNLSLGSITGIGGLTKLGVNSITLTGTASFSGGLNVASGTLTILTPGSYSGNIILSGGTLAVPADAELGAASNKITFSGGALEALNSFTTNRSFVSTNGTFDIAGATVTQSGTLSGSGIFTKTGSGTWQKTGSDPFTGSLLILGGAVSLAGPSGAMPDVSGIDLQTTGTLDLNSSTALGGNQTTQNRINDAAPITLDGGTLSVEGANGVTTTETLGELVPHYGASTIALTDGTTTNSDVTLHFSSLGGSSAGATIGFVGSDLGNTEKVFFSSGVADGTVFGGGVTVNGTDFAKYSAAQGVIPFAKSDYSINVFAPASNVKLDPSVTSPRVPGSVGTVSIKTLNIAANTAAVSVNQTNGTTLTLTNGGLIKSGIDAASIGGGTLTSSSGELDISVQGAPLSISSALAGNFVLTKRGSGTLALTGSAASTYTGFTLVSGEMDLNKSGGALAIPGNVNIDGGLLKSLASNQIASSATVTLNYGTWDLNGQTENISKLNNSTGTMLFHGGKLTVANGVTLSGGTTTVASTLTSNAFLAVSGGDNEVHPDGLVTTDALNFSGTNPSVQLYSGPNTSGGELSLPAGANMSFTGTGTALISSVGTGAAGILELGNSNNHTITVSPNDTLVISASIPDGGFTVQGGGTLVLSGDNFFDGTTKSTVTLGTGTTLVDSDTSAKNVLSNLLLAGGTLSLSSDAPSPFFDVTPVLTAAGTINLSSVTPGVSPGVFNLEELQINSSSGLTVTGAGTLAAVIYISPSVTGSVYIHNSANLVVGVDGHGTILGPTTANLIKDQAGSLTFQGFGASSFGSLTVDGGGTFLNQSSGVAIPGNLSIFAGSLVQLEQSNEISPTANITLNAATGNSLLDLNGNNNTIGSLSFVAGGTMNTGTGVATLGGGVSFTGTAGTAVINGNLDLGATTPAFNISGSSTAVDLQINATITGDAGATGINKTGSGVLYLAGTNSFTGPITISAGTVKVDQALAGAIAPKPGGTLDLDPNRATGILVRNIGAVSFTSGSAPFGQLNVLPAANHSNRQLVVTTGLTIPGTTNAWQGKIDLANNDMDVPGGSLATLTNQIKQGYNAAKWNGSAGITSTTAAADTKHLTALGIIQNNQSGTALFTAAHEFDGTVPGAADVLIKFTYYGDTNLDGTVNSTDTARVSASIANNANPKNTPLTGWFNGDFNYDGVINGSDMTLLDNSLNSQGAQLSAIIDSPSAAPTAQIAGTTPVPEPAVLGILGLATIGLLGRSRRDPQECSRQGSNLQP